MIVREYAPADLGGCPALFDELVDTHRSLYRSTDIGGEFALEGSVFVAEEDGRVIGYAGLIWHGRRAELEPIAIASTHRGRGAGRTLAQRVVREAREGGAIRIFVRPVGRNRDAIAFLHAVGFDVLGRIELQIDFEERERRPSEHIAGREFRV